MTKKLLISLLLLTGGVATSFAQEATYKERAKVEKTDSEVLSIFRGLTIGGLVQAQWQMAQKKGMDGGPASSAPFPEGSNNRFMLRRGYLKVAYESKYFASTVQINATADGVSLVNAFAQINTESKSAALRMGHIYKPFGYFVSYPSGNRLTPEVSRGELTLFPDATGSGARVMLRNTKDHWTRDLALDLCYFNGSMVGTDHFASQDFIGKLEYARQFEKVMLGAQFSILKGTMVNMTDTYYSFEKYDTKFTKNSGVKGSRLSKSYYSFGATVGFKSVIGETKITGEYITGNQLSLANDNITPSRKFIPTNNSDLYSRRFTNYYIFLHHQIAKTNLGVIARYDSMDPNCDNDGSSIGTYNGTTAADLRYNTFGFGLYYKFFKYMSASAYYDIVNHEKTTGIDGYNINRKNNLLTLRLQCFF